MSSFYLDGIYAFWESKRGEETKEVVVPEAAHWRSVQQRAEAQRYKEEQVEKAKRVALKAVSIQPHMTLPLSKSNLTRLAKRCGEGRTTSAERRKQPLELFAEELAFQHQPVPLTRMERPKDAGTDERGAKP